MKKILSLLLALTMVLSLAIVPARADEEDDTPKINGLSITKSVDSVDRGDGVKFEVTATSPSLSGIEGSPAIDADSYEYSWNVGSNFKVNSGATAKAVQTTAIKAIDKTAVSCTVTCSYTVGEGDAATHGTVSTVVTLDNIAITNKLLPTDIDRVTFNGRTFDVTDGSVTISTIGDEQIDGSANTWKAHSKTEGYTIDNETNKPSYASNKLTVKTTDTSPLSTEISVNSQKASVSAAANPTEVVTGGGKTTLTATPTGLSNSADYKWYLKKTSGADDEIGTGKTFTWTVPTVSASTDYKVYCKASETVSGRAVPAATSNEVTVKVVPDIYRIYLSKTSLSFNKLNEGQSFKAGFEYLDSSDNTYKSVADTVTYNFSSSNTSAVSVTPSSNTTGDASVKLTSNVSSAKVTVSVTYKGRTFTNEVRVNGSFLEATLSSVQNGDTAKYSYSDLVSAAQTAINRNNGSSNYETVYSLSNVKQIAPLNTYGTGTSTATYTYNTGSGRLTFYASSSNIGTAKFSADVTTRTKINDSETTKSYSITFNIPVKPTTTTYEDQYPEPVASGNTYRYYVQVPSGAKYYYVAGVNNEPSDWNNGSGTKYYTTTASTSLYSLTDSSFTNGKCTLYVVTQGTDNKLYCGTITVYQKNYNINYNGVAGETVQFKQADFNDFMEEVAKARGDVSTRNSYPYVTFDNVTFTMPTTQQGTLYYNGTAMSTRSGSSYFNSSTKVTNLDNITFVPYAKTNAKTITLNFTLNATKYTSASSKGTTVSYSGAVVVSIVREDIKYTVAQGDTVRFTDSDFLTYLRSQSGFSSNYTIDYVTFDQSAVSTVNDGVLYSYYNSGTNYGSAAKTTDKFYYTTTSYNQNALSDVAFRASNYAKYGDTVYIPFTIYARYGSTGTGTRQLTGTVAIQIGQTMNFTDVKAGDFFYEPVKWAVSRNITNGTSNTTFSPYKTCTRAEIVTFLWRAAGSPEPTITRNPFNDVNAVTHSSYYKAILWASQKGITSGTSATSFSPDATCTRAQIVTFLYRYAGKPSSNYANPFKDVNATTEASYYNAILWAVGKNITTGTSSTTFSPYASCTRGEAVTFLYRYVNGVN